MQCNTNCKMREESKEEYNSIVRKEMGEVEGTRAEQRNG